MAATLLTFFLRQMRSREVLLPVAIGLIFGGMIGNIVDRVRFGEVVDFLSFHIRNETLNFSLGSMSFSFPLEWPAFNIADSAITIAMALLVLSALRKGPRHGG